jgi:hypothetical protein
VASTRGGVNVQKGGIAWFFDAKTLFDEKMWHRQEGVNNKDKEGR